MNTPKRGTPGTSWFCVRCREVSPTCQHVPLIIDTNSVVRDAQGVIVEVQQATISRR